GECPLGVRTIAAACAADSARDAFVSPCCVGSTGLSIVRSSSDVCSGTRQWRQRTADSGFSRPHEGHFMVEGLTVCRKSNYPLRTPHLQAVSLPSLISSEGSWWWRDSREIM